jgi:predicted unusual protein kinase regulating ubiquinone biosynthesis (AarF/ABC1/UbiB family)
MEYVEGAVNISRAVQHFRPADPLAYRRELARKFLFTILSQLFVYQELHGDLHPGNVMVDRAGRLHLIDWGNTVQLAGKVKPVLDYLKGALVADADLLTDALIAISTEPEAAQARRAARSARRWRARAAEEADPPAVLHLRLDLVPRRARRLAQARQYPAAACVEHPAARPGAARRIPAPVALTDGP